MFSDFKTKKKIINIAATVWREAGTHKNSIFRRKGEKLNDVILLSM